MTFYTDREKEIYAAEMAQLSGNDQITREMHAERAVFLERDLRSGGFRQQATHHTPDNRGRCRKQYRKVATNAAELYQACADECQRRFGGPAISWLAHDRQEWNVRSKRFVACGLRELIGRYGAAKACGASVSTIDHWTKRVQEFPLEARDGVKFCATLPVKWERVLVSDIVAHEREGRAA